MHPQCITERSVDGALKRAESPSGAIDEGDAALLAAEVRRLRETQSKMLDLFEVERKKEVALSTELERERMRLAACGVAAHGGDSACLPEYESDALTATRKLQTKLARIEAWYARTTTSDPDELCDAMDELGNTILRDPQPSAAPTPPKKGEPYNGW